MATKRYPLLDKKIYHIFSKSIAGFEIFRSNSDYKRMRNVLKYYKIENPPLRFSAFMEIKDKAVFYQKHFGVKESLVEIISYCIMPTHIHLILKQLKKSGISVFMSNSLNSYSRYFNIKSKRRGPLWESRFKNVDVTSDEQLLHLTRYIHLNPVTANLVDGPQDWNFSSYKEFLGEIQDDERICNSSGSLSVAPEDYKEFVSSQIIPVTSTP